MPPGKKISQEDAEAIIEECINMEYFEGNTGKLVFRAATLLAKQFKVVRKTINRVCRDHFSPRIKLRNKRVSRHGGSNGRPPKVTAKVRILINAAGQKLADQYDYFTAKYLWNELHHKNVNISLSTLYKYIKYELKVQKYRVPYFVLVDGPVWDELIDTPYDIGMETFDQFYKCDDLVITLWDGVTLPTKRLHSMFNYQDNLEDNYEYNAMGGYRVLRYVPVFTKL